MKALGFSRGTLFLAGILALAFVLRVWGVRFGLPFLYHADEPIVVNHALAFGMGDLNPHFFKIPPLVSYLLFLCYGIYCLIGCAAGIFHSVRDFEQLFYFDPSSFYLIGRLVFGVLLGTLSVLVLFRLVKRCMNEQAALWAAFFLAVNFLHVRDSHYLYVDIPLLCVLLLGFSSIVRIPEDPGAWKWHLMSGALIGLAAAIKYNGAFLIVPYFWVCVRRVPWKQWPGRRLLAFVAAAGVFFLFNPYALIDHAFFIKELTEQSASNTGGMPWYHHLTYSLAGALGWPMLALALLGVLRALFAKDVRLKTLAVFVTGYYAVLWRFGQPYDRYVLPLIPFLLILAAEVLDGLKKRSRLLFWVILPFAMMPSVIKTVHWDLLMSKPDVRTVAKDWIEANIPSGTSLALDGTFFMPRLAFSSKQLEEKRLAAFLSPQPAAKVRRIDALLSKPHQPSYDLYFMSMHPESPGFLFADPQIPFDLETLKQKGVQYVVLVDALRPEGDAFYEALQANADRVVTFSPYRDPEDLTIHDPQSMTGGPFLLNDIITRKRNGYPLSVYRLHS